MEFELSKIIDEINKNKYKTVVIQLPDGLKPKAIDIQREIENKTKANVLIWGGSNFGACDIPNIKCDLLINFGHSKWK